MPLFGPRLPVLNWPSGNRSPFGSRSSGGVPAPRGSSVGRPWERDSSSSTIPLRPANPILGRPISPSPNAAKTLEPGRPLVARPVSPSPGTARPSSPARTSNTSSAPAKPARAVSSTAVLRSASSIIATEAFAKVVDALLEAGKDAAKDSAEKLIVDGVHKLLEELSEALSGPQALDRPEGGHPEVHETPLLQSLEAHEQFPLSKTVHIVEMVNDVPTTYLAAIVVLQKVDPSEVGIHDDLLQSVHKP